MYIFVFILLFCSTSYADDNYSKIDSKTIEIVRDPVVEKISIDDLKKECTHIQFIINSNLEDKKRIEDQITELQDKLKSCQNDISNANSLGIN